MGAQEEIHDGSQGQLPPNGACWAGSDFREYRVPWLYIPAGHNETGKIMSSLTSLIVILQIAELSKGIVEQYRAQKRGKLQRTFCSASDAANSKVNRV